MTGNDTIKPMQDLWDYMAALDIPTLEKVHRGLYELQLMEDPLLVEGDKSTDLSKALDVFSLFTSRLLIIKLMHEPKGGTT